MRVQRRGDNAHDWELYHGDGRIGIEWYFRQTTSLPASVMLYRLEPGAEEGQHHHLDDDPDSCSPNSSDEMYIVTRGEIVVMAGDDRRVLGVGDAFYAPEGMRHGVRNESDTVAELVLVFGPRGPHPFPQTGVEEFDAEAER
ncbi:cupin domain-containing protein [Microbacterium sp. C5A9]|uniref:cupin domain-containing protein n=1 Tax=Microbacterium sp. C5A9 TaxID=2736663 RepID=UPI001F51AFC7|nr:cupin domain-containing protein [Microbacterium sp. C5A9]MCI1018963.1 cupin domain-containing protein [Microbacterium sp. C5A9]